MPFITIPWIHTADPADIWTQKSVFAPSDPFAIVMRVVVSSDIVSAGLRYDRVFQMVNPRQDPWHSLWYTRISDDFYFSDTVDWHGYDRPFRFTDFATPITWAHYSDPVSHLWGPDAENGIFYVRGTIDVKGSNLFAYSPEFWYKVRGQTHQ